MTPLFVFQSTIDTLSQDSAPSYATYRDIFVSALNHAMQSIDSSKTAGITWIGPGPRVTRRVRDGLAVPGGVTSAVWILGYSGAAPDIISQPSEYAGFIGSIVSDITNQLRAEPSMEAYLRPQGITGPIAEYDPAHNGPLSFWTSSQASTTHTRDSFPQTNAVGTPSADQFENPIGPNDPAIVPNTPPPTVPDPSGALKTLAVTVGVLGAVYVIVTIVSAARSTSNATRPLLSARQRARYGLD